MAWYDFLNKALGYDEQGNPLPDPNAPPPVAPYNDANELARIQNRAGVMAPGPTLRDAYGSPSGDVGLGVAPNPGAEMSAIPEGIPAPGTGYVQGPDGKVQFLGGNPYDKPEEGGDQLPGGLPPWAYGLKTTRYRRPGQPDLEVSQVNAPGHSLADIALADKVAPAFKDLPALKSWFKQSTGRDLPEGFEPQQFRSEARAQKDQQMQEDTAARAVVANTEKLRQERFAVDRSYDGAMTQFNERMKSVNSLLTNTSGLWGITGRIGGQDIPEYLRDDKSRKALADYEQIQAQTFMQALEQLKNASKSGATGLGQLTEVEGKKIQTAVAALKRTQSYEDFAEKLKIYQAQLAESQRRLQTEYLANVYKFPNARAFEKARQEEIARRQAARGQ